MSDAREYRVMLEDIIGAYSEHGDGPGLKALLMDANNLLIDNAVSHRHEGWEGPSEACPICRYKQRIAELEAENEDIIKRYEDWRADQIDRVEALERAIREAPCPKHMVGADGWCVEGCCDCDVPRKEDCDCWKREALK